MEQLKMKDIYNLIIKLQSEMSLNEILELPIYLGNDDELNGIHCAWYNELIDSEDKTEDMQYTIEMINERSGNNELKGKGILIS